MEESPFRGAFRFSQKSISTHLLDFFRSPLPIVVLAGVIFGTLWTISEVPIHLSGNCGDLRYPYLILISASVLLSLTWNAYLYFQRTPEGLDEVPANARRIAHLQRPHWEFQLAKTLLAQRLAPVDQELRDLESGRQFVLAEKPASMKDYMRWLGTRTDNLFSMLAVCQALILSDFPRAIQSTDQRSASPQEILKVVNSISRFYRETLEFEKAARAIIPSEDFRVVHQLQLGWSDSVRDGVRQLFQFLQEMCECDPNASTNVKFEIVFDAPPQVDQFCDQLDELSARYRELEERW